MAITTLTICEASSRVGARISAWQSRLFRSMFCSRPAQASAARVRVSSTRSRHRRIRRTRLVWPGLLWLMCVSRRAQVARTDREGRGLAGSRLGLSDRVTHQDERLDRTLLDRRGLLETVGVDATEEILLQAHVVKAFGNCTRMRASAQSRGDGAQVRGAVQSAGASPSSQLVSTRPSSLSVTGSKEQASSATMIQVGGGSEGGRRARGRGLKLNQLAFLAPWLLGLVDGIEGWLHPR